MASRIFFNIAPNICFVKQLAMTLLFNTLIALILNYLVFNGELLNNFISSQIIGLTIFLTFHAGYSLRYFSFKKEDISLAATITFLSIGSLLGVLLLLIVSSALGNISLYRVLGENYEWLIQTLLLALLFGSVMIYFFRSRERIIKAESELQKQQISSLDYEKRLLQTNLQRMQAQIEPHFLFNTLSNVLGLIDTNPRRGKSMLQSFTHYLRSTLDYTRSESAVLEDEIKIVSSYLDIFQVRMGKRLTYAIDIPKDLLNITFPPMLLQPLVENAIKHGLEPVMEGGHICISAEKTGSNIKVIVEDTGQGLQGDSGTGIGITNVQKRLHALYGSRAKLSLEENQPHGLRAAIEVPYDNN